MVEFSSYKAHFAPQECKILGEWWRKPPKLKVVHLKRKQEGGTTAKGCQRDGKAFSQRKKNGRFNSRILKIMWLLYHWEEHTCSRLSWGMLTKASFFLFLHGGLPSCPNGGPLPFLATVHRAFKIFLWRSFLCGNGSFASSGTFATAPSVIYISLIGRRYDREW
jgi:hypothetical protein